MKKALVLLSLLTALSFTACGKAGMSANKAIERAPAETEAESPTKTESAQVTAPRQEEGKLTEPGVSTFILDSESVKALEIEALLLSIEFCNVDPQTLSLDPSCPALGVLKDLRNPKAYRMAEGVDFNALCKPHFNEDHPKLFAWLIDNADCILKLDNSTDSLIEMGKNAKTEIVLTAVMNALVKKSIVGTHSTPETIDFALTQVAHPHRAVRAAVATLIIGPMSRTVGGVAEAGIKLLGDVDDEISSDVCQRIGDLRNSAVVPAIAAILKDPKQRDKHADCMRGLSKMWPYGPDTLNPPSYRSDAAYKASLAYLKTKPRNTNIPHWGAIADASRGGGFGHLKPELYIHAMIDIALDKMAHPEARTHAITCVGNWGDRASFDVLKKKLQAAKAEEIYMKAIEDSEKEQMRSIEQAYLKNPPKD